MKRVIFFATILMVFVSCKEPERPTVVYSGTQREAIIDNILNRRAIRKYTDQQVSTAQIDTLMECAIYAPSALNKQPWEVRVIQNPDILKEINQRFLNYAEGRALQGSAARYKEPGFSIFHNAPSLVVIAGDKSNAFARMDIGILMQNILLSAHALGLGTCPIGSLVPVLNLPENNDLLKLMNVPDDYEVVINISLGYPDENPPAPVRYTEKVKIIQ